MPQRGRRNFRRNSQKQVIQSVKNSHEFKSSTIAGASIDTSLADAVEVGEPTKITGKEVPVGAKVFSIELWINTSSQSGGEDGTIDWYIAKARDGQLLGSFPEPDFSTTGLSSKRNQIFHQEAQQFGSQDAGPYKFHRRIKIPRIYQRMRSGDFIFIKSNASIVTSLQIAALYKYYQ